MYSDVTTLELDLTNLEAGTLNPYTDLPPLYWYCLHDYWIHLLRDLGNRLINEGMRLLVSPAEFKGGPTDFFDLPLIEAPFRYIPDSIRIDVYSLYNQLDKNGPVNADD